MIELREFELSDIDPIDRIFKKQPGISVPGFKHLVANSSIVRKNGNGSEEVVGYGSVKFFAEGILILDQSIPKRDRAEAVKLSVERAIKEAKAHGIENLYFLTKIPSFADVLRKRWNFSNMNEELLVLRLDEIED